MRAVLAGYCQCCDDGRFEEWAQLFAEDAVVEVLGNRHVGRGAARAFIEAAQPPEARGKHLTLNSLIEVSDGEPATASAVSDFAWLAKRPEGFAVTQAGRYEDTFRCDRDGRWRFTSRKIHLWGE